MRRKGRQQQQASHLSAPTPPGEAGLRRSLGTAEGDPRHRSVCVDEARRAEAAVTIPMAPGRRRRRRRQRDYSCMQQLQDRVPAAGRARGKVPPPEAWPAPRLPYPDEVEGGGGGGGERRERQVAD